ncbi:MAG: ribonuclease D [Pseudohongiellaceae bacterium]
MDANNTVTYVTSNDEFNALCEKWQKLSAIAIDTEFMRTNTFYAKIGLLQIADRERIYLIDPLEIKDWDGFRNLLNSPDCTIVVHSAGEDLNLLLTHIGCLPCCLFDTQIAAAFLGYGFSLSYQALVEKLVGVTVEKGETRSDWLRRPLSPSQLQYAASDVLYLLEVADTLRESLIEKSRLSWFASECQLLLSAAEQVEDEANWGLLYANVSNSWRLNDQALKYLKTLCIWRERESRERNRPRSWIAKDNDLYSLAESAAGFESITEESLKSIKVQETKFLSRYAKEFKKLLSESKSDLATDKSVLNYPLESSDRKVLKKLQKVVETKAEEFNLAPELLGRKKHLLEIIKRFKLSGKVSWEEANNDWRSQLLETEFSKLLKVGG